MSNVIIKTRISPELKEQAEAVFNAIGMTTAEAIRVFLKQAVNSGGLPFQPTAKMPNAETAAAIMQLEDGGGERFQTTEELFADCHISLQSPIS